MSEYTQQIVALWTPQGLDWLWIFLIVLLIFGKKLPDVARSLGKSLTQFKKGLREVEDEIEQTKQDIDKEVDDTRQNIAGQSKDTAGPNDSKKTN